MSEPYIGLILNVGFTFAPRSYATCDGQLLAINQNAALFSLLGTTYGGNGTTTFALPNLQGRNAIHRGQAPGTSVYNQGQVGGQENVTLTAANLATHTHTATYVNSGGSTLTANNSKGTTAIPTAGYRLARGVDGDASPNASPYIYVPSAATNQVALNSINVAGTPNVAIAGGGVPLNIIKPYTTILSVIALFGIFPSRN